MVGSLSVSRRRAVFLDRDGVLVVPEMRDGRSFAPRQLKDFRVYPEAQAALSRLKRAGYLLVVVTNQPDVGNGKISRFALAQMHSRLCRELPIDRIEVCCHRRTDDCSCRKPKPGMLVNAAQVYGIELKDSFMVGDRGSDVAAGIAVGCKTIFIDLEYESEPKPESFSYCARSIAEAAEIILRVSDLEQGGRTCRS